MHRQRTRVRERCLHELHWASIVQLVQASFTHAGALPVHAAESSAVHATHAWICVSHTIGAHSAFVVQPLEPSLPLSSSEQLWSGASAQ